VLRQKLLNIIILYWAHPIVNLLYLLGYDIHSDNVIMLTKNTAKDSPTYPVPATAIFNSISPRVYYSHFPAQEKS
jgi:hypothetical protein